MSNYMADVAKVLGVELGECFHISCNPNNYFLCHDGMVCVESGHMVNGALNDLLVGKLTIKREPWKPKYDEHYYYVGNTGYVYSPKWFNDVLDISFYKIGNCYRTKEEAESNRDKWVSFYASDRVLEV